MLFNNNRIKLSQLSIITIISFFIFNLTAIATEEKDQISQLSNPQTLISKKTEELTLQSQQNEIIKMLIDRFNNITEPLEQQINKITNPLILQQILQLAQVTNSLEDFTTIIEINFQPKESLFTFNSNSLIASDLEQKNKYKYIENIDFF